MSREKSYIMTQLDGNNHSVFSLNYHLILITKYRKEVITDVISEYLKHIFCYIAPKYKITLAEWNHDKDHIHILFKAEPDSEISKFINAYKAASSRLVKKNFPEIRNKLWKEYFWSRSYCLITAGGAPLEILKEYIRTQGEDYDGVRDGIKQPTVAGSMNQKRGRDLKPESRRHDQPTERQRSCLFPCSSRLRTRCRSRCRTACPGRIQVHPCRRRIPTNPRHPCCL